MRRIFPLYYGVLIVLNVASQFSSGIAEWMPPHPLFDFVYLSNWTDTQVPFEHLKLTGHFWTLAIEEQFYLIWPLCVRLAPNSRYLRNICVAGCLFALAFRCLLVLTGAAGPEFLYKALFLQMDTLLIGALCAILVRNPETFAKLRPFVVPTAVLSALLAFGVPALRHRVENSHVDPTRNL